VVTGEKGEVGGMELGVRRGVGMWGNKELAVGSG
jgi:hypothetical protein